MLQSSDYLRYLRRKEIATVVLQLQLFTHCCLVLRIICVALVLHLGHATGGARILLAWHSSCHTSQVVLSFQCHHWQPITGSLQCLQRLKEHKKFAMSQVSVVSGDIFRWGGQVDYRFVFFCGNANNQKYVWIILLKMTLFGFPKVKWLHLTGELDKSVQMSNFVRI